MNIENELSPIKLDDIEETISELATIQKFEDISDIPEDLIDCIINLE